VAKRTPAQRLDAVRQSKNTTIARLTAELVILREALEKAQTIVAKEAYTDSGIEAVEVLEHVHRALEQTPVAREALRAFRVRQLLLRAAQIGDGDGTAAKTD